MSLRGNETRAGGMVEVYRAHDFHLRENDRPSIFRSTEKLTLAVCINFSVAGLRAIRKLTATKA
jgi:hypothetical protein